MAEHGMTARDLQGIDNSLNFASGKENDMANRIRKVDNMNTFDKFWDSQVPRNKRGFFPSFSFSLSDPEVLKKEITKHRDFYAIMKDVFHQVRNGEEVAELIQDLYQMLQEMYVEAESKKDYDDSKTLCRLHEEFLALHMELENKIRRVEVTDLRQQLRRTRNDWGIALEQVTNLAREIEQARDENNDLRDRFERLMTVNEQLLSEQENTRQENGLIRTLLEQIIARRIQE